MEQMTESKRNVSDMWIKNNIYDALESIETCERRMKSGCSDLLEHIQQMNLSPSSIIQVQIKNMELMINEFQILIENVRDIIKGDECNKVKEQIDTYEKLFHEGMKTKEGFLMVYQIVVNNKGSRVQKQICLTVLFDKLCTDLCILRSRMVGNLSHILYLKEKNSKLQREI